MRSHYQGLAGYKPASESDFVASHYFSAKEFVCKCGKDNCDAAPIDVRLLRLLTDLRGHHGNPITITSGSRCAKHPAERKRVRQGKIGAHAMGLAADILCSGVEAYEILALLLQKGMGEPYGGNPVRIGVQQRGPHTSRFLHVDIAQGTSLPSPTVWSY